jgi:uncharacterized repeat protein (TIGR03803 family)
MSATPISPRKSGMFFLRPCAMAFAIFLATTAAQAATEKVLYMFHTAKKSSKDGVQPNSTLVFDAAGNLYGTTERGGLKNGGTVFELTPQPDGSWQETILHLFTGTVGGADGFGPSSGVVFDAAGNLFGTASGGPGGGSGIVFELSPGTKGWTETLIHTFGQPGDGEYPGPITLDANANIYGTTYQGRSPCNYGSVFQLAPNPGGDWTENQLHCFTESYGPDAAYLLSGVTLDPAGNLYGTSLEGGSDDNGAVYEVSPSGDGWTETVLYSFGDNAWHPGGPYAGVILDKKGNLYGTEPFGGDTGFGSVYELKHTAKGREEITLYSFQNNGVDGIFPELGNLVFDKAGNLYGTTGDGGTGGPCGRYAYGCGTVFELSPTKDGWQEIILYSFQGGSDGAWPDQGLVLDSNGNLYGTTEAGGTCKHKKQGCGTVFEITP